MTSICTAGLLNSQDNRVYNFKLADDVDLDVVMDMGRKFYSTMEMAKMIPFDEDSATAQVFHMLDNGFIIIAEHNDTPVGMIGCAFYDYPYNKVYQGCAEMMFWVEEEHRGSTVAARLMKEAEAIAVHEGATFVVMAALETSPERIDEFYNRMGYKRSERAFIKGV